MKTKGKRACRICGTLFSDSNQPCPVCALRGALSSNRAISESTVELSLWPAQLRFGHYEILAREDGTALELGHGAMGVT